MEQTREKRLAIKKEYRKKADEKIKEDRKKYIKTHRGRATRLLSSCRRRAKLSKSEMNLTTEWVQQKLEKGICEVTGLPFSYEREEQHTRSAFAPSVDRINPQNTNYTPDNCRVVLWSVNNIFSEYGEQLVLPILEAILNAKQNEPTPLSIEHVVLGKPHSPHRFVLGTRTWEDRYGADYHSGESPWEDLDRCTQKGSRNGVVTGMWEMGTFTLTYNGKSYGLTDGAGVGLEELQRLIYCKLRELGLVVGTQSEVRLSDNRREQPIQRSLDETLQGIKEASKGL